MRFTLTYRGPLPPSGKPVDKQAIRDQLEPQIRELWTHEPLVGRASRMSVHPTPEGEVSALHETQAGWFQTIISAEFGLIAELDILMLRPELPGGIVISGGDIDNRLKTLFDGLRPPLSVQESRLQSPPTPAHPFHVLLSDDELITRVNVETDRLLAAPTRDVVHVVIRVTTRVRRAMFANLGM